jgi:hypothetical protein
MAAPRALVSAVAVACAGVLAGGLTVVASSGGPTHVGGVNAAVGRGHGVGNRPVSARADRAGRPNLPVGAPRLRRLSAPDLWVELPRPVTPTQLSALRRTRGLRAITVLDIGTITLAGHRLRALGADLGTARGLSPRFTAQSDPLWSSLARGEVTLSHAARNVFGRSLGATVATGSASNGSSAATPSGGRPLLRIGAFASLGLGSAQAMVSHEWSGSLGLRTARVVVIAAPTRTTAALVAQARSVVGARATIRVLRPPKVGRPVVSAYARALIPAGYLALYQRAALTCRGLPWTVLAAIGTVESRNGADTRTSSAGARGPMQFLPSTWAGYGVDADDDGRADIDNPVDAVYSAARYLCSWGAGLGGQSLADAIWAYNHADWYVRQVIALAVALS